MKVTWLCLAAAFRIGFALNPIHESSYNLEPGGNFPAPATLSLGAIVRSQETSAFQVPVSLAFKAGRELELGAGLKTDWGADREHVPYLVFGAKWMTPGRTGIQADLLVGTHGDGNNGLSIATHHRFQYSSNFYSRLAVRLGFMNALVDGDALMAFETGFYPTLDLTRSLALELGFIGSSQTGDFESHLAIDAQPALKVAFARYSSVETGIALGLAGDRKEEMRVKISVIHGF